MINSLLERYQGNGFYNFDFLSSCAEVLWDADQIEEAVGYFEQLIEKEPQYYMGNKNLAHYYYTKGIYAKMQEFDVEFEKIYSLMEQNFKKWER